MSGRKNHLTFQSVVSANVDPDTIELSKSWTGDVDVVSYNIGSKRTQIVMDTIAESSCGVKEALIDEEFAIKLSMTQEQILKLGRVAVLIENEFGNPRDIEWAYCKVFKLHILTT